jgi:methyl-accepting chemotaxis protein
MSMITLLGLLILGVVYQFASDALQDQFDQRAFYIATNLSDGAAAHVVRRNVLELYGLVRKYALLEGVEYAFIADDKGMVIAHTLGTFPLELKETVSAEGRRHTQRQAVRLSGKIVYDTSVPILGGQVGDAHLGMRRDFVQGEIRHAVLPMIGIISAIIIGGIAFSSLFVWMMIRPIRHLRHMAVGMSKGDLDTPLDIGVRSHDEIGDLARSLERMRSSLKAAMSRLSEGHPY